MKFSQIVIFDWDGTLYDSEGLMEIARTRALQAMGEEVDLLSGALLGNMADTQEGVEAIISWLSAAQEKEFRTKVKMYFIELERACRLKRGMAELLASLGDCRDTTLCIATGRERRRLQADLKKLGLLDMFAIAVCANECRAKPSADCLIQIMDALQVSPEQCLFVGDCLNDELCAREAGVDFLGVRIDYRIQAPSFSSQTNMHTCARSLQEAVLAWKAHRNVVCRSAPVLGS